MPSPTIPLINPAPGESEELIRRLVRRFYKRVLNDPDLGPIFKCALSHRWEEHLSTMVNFWSSVALRTGRYHGKPHAAHAPLGLSAVLFQRWLALFDATAREICEPDVAAFFTDPRDGSRTGSSSGWRSARRSRRNRFSRARIIFIPICRKVIRFRNTTSLFRATAN